MTHSVQGCESKVLGRLRRKDTAGKLGLMETAARFQGAKECVGGKEMEPADRGQKGRDRVSKPKGQEVESFKHETNKYYITRIE